MRFAFGLRAGQALGSVVLDVHEEQLFAFVEGDEGALDAGARGGVQVHAQRVHVERREEVLERFAAEQLKPKRDARTKPGLVVRVLDDLADEGRELVLVQGEL